MALDGAEARLPDDMLLVIKEPPLGTEKLLLLKGLLGGTAVTDTDLSADIIPSNAHNPLELEHRPERPSGAACLSRAPSDESAFRDDSPRAPLLWPSAMSARAAFSAKVAKDFLEASCAGPFWRRKS